MSKIIGILKSNPVLYWVLGFQLFRLFLLPHIGLMPQDAYYHFYGEHLSLSYFDHPGMIGYILRFFTEIFGKTVFVVKFADFFITTLTLFSFYSFSKKFLSTSRSNVALVLITTSFFISITSFNSTPDVPLLLFWTLALTNLYLAIFNKNKIYWLFSGVFMGLAFNSKYTAILLPIGLILFLLFSKNYRKLFFNPWLWLSLLVTVLISSPVWIWNYNHDFVSFLFQSSNRTSEMGFKIYPNFFLGTIAHQLLLTSPFILFLFIVLTYKYIKRFLTKFKLPSAKILFLLAFFIPTFLGFLSISPLCWVKMNWLMPSYITGYILISIFLKNKTLKWHLLFTVIIQLLISVQLLFNVFPIKSDDTYLGWKELHEAVKERQTIHQNTFVFSDDYYKTSAVLNFYTDDFVYAQNVIGLPALHFDYISTDLKKLIGKNGLFIDSDARFKNANKHIDIPNKLKPYFNKITELKPIIIKKEGEEIRKFWIYFCEGYKIQ